MTKLNARVARELSAAVINDAIRDHDALCEACAKNPGVDPLGLIKELGTIQKGLRADPTPDQGLASKVAAIVVGTVLTGSVLAGLVCAVLLVVRFTLATWGWL